MLHGLSVIPDMITNGQITLALCLALILIASGVMLLGIALFLLLRSL